MFDETLDSRMNNVYNALLPSFNKKGKLNTFTKVLWSKYFRNFVGSITNFKIKKH